MVFMLTVTTMVRGHVARIYFFEDQSASMSIQEHWSMPESLQTPILAQIHINSQVVSHQNNSR